MSNLVLNSSMVLIISEPHRGWEKALMASKCRKGDEISFKNYIVSDGSAVWEDYWVERDNGYCIALLDQDKNCWEKHMNDIIIHSKKKHSNIFIFLHETRGPEPDQIRLKTKAAGIQIDMKRQIRIFHHTSDFEFIEKLLSTVNNIKNKSGIDKELTNNFTEAFKKTLAEIIPYTIPHNLISLHLVAQGISLIEKELEDSSKDNRVKELKREVKDIIEEGKLEDIKKEIEGLEQANDKPAAKASLSNLLLSIISIRNGNTNLNQLEESLNCLYELELWYPE